MARAKKPSKQRERAEKRAELRALIRSKLAKLRPLILERLRRITAADPPAGVALLKFEIHDACHQVTVSLYAVDEQWRPVEVRRPFEGSLLDRAFPDFDRIDWEAYRKGTGEHPLPYIELVLLEEFRAWWAAVGGTKYPLRAAIGWHGSFPPTDLVTGKPVNHLGSPGTGDRELLEAVVELHRLLGRPPTAGEMTAFGRYSLTPYRDRWGSWGAARQAAYETLGVPEGSGGGQAGAP